MVDESVNRMQLIVDDDLAVDTGNSEENSDHESTNQCAPEEGVRSADP